MLKIIVGKSGTGKTSIVNEMIKLGMKKVVTYTTRPQRENEVDGVDYHFVSKEEFLNMRDAGEFFETTEYSMAHNEVVYYGTPNYKVENKSVIILNPDGLKHFMYSKPVEYISFLIVSDNDDIRDRLIERGDSGDEIMRRMLADEKDFYDIEKSVDYIIENGKNGNIHNIADFILQIGETYER